MSENFSVPRNLTDTLFRDLQLPEYSKILSKKNITGPESENRNAITQSKYRQSADDEFMALDLGEVSTIHKNGFISNKEKEHSTSTEEDSRPMAKVTPGSRMNKRKNKNKPELAPKKEVDIDNQIGQIAQWAERGAKDNEDDDFDNDADKVGETAEQQEIRRKLEDKLKNGFGQKNKGGGLAAKAEQLRRAKQTQKQTSSVEELLEKKHLKNADLSKSISLEHETSTEMLVTKQSAKPQQRAVQKQESQDDPWERVNQRTIQQQQRRKQKQKEMSSDLVLKFYQEEFKFEEADIQIQEIQIKQSKEQPGCLEMLCACFKTEEKKKKTVKNNVAIAKRLVAISKKQLTNTDQQFFILQQIWAKLTPEPFSRYGDHWNQIGFQGRDPATDLRSTGVLSILQWFTFLQNHSKQGTQFATWSIENEYPLALTHIKITGVFLDLLLRGSLTGEKWSDFQTAYNAFVISMFKKMKSQFKGGSTMGTLVEEEARDIKKHFQKEISLYLSEYKK